MSEEIVNESFLDYMKELFESSFDQSWLPAEMLEIYSPLECLADNSGCTTLLLSRRSDGEKCVAKCYSKEEGEVSVTENEILASVSHKGLPAYMGKYENDTTVCVLREYIKGVPLDKIIRKRKFTADEVAFFALKLCDILSYLHSLPSPIVHRDIKPGNIIIDEEDNVYLIDFGISRIVRDTEKRDTKIAATAVYAPPEQFGFLPTDARSDIYALGVVLNEMLTGSLNSAEAPSDKEINRIVRKCTEFSPKDRYKNAKQLAGDIRRWKYRWLWIAATAIAAAVIIGLAALGAVTVGNYISAPPQEETVVYAPPVSRTFTDSEGVFWSANTEEGVMTVSGKGYLSDEVWKKLISGNAKNVYELVISEGVSGIGNINYINCRNLKKVFIPASAVGNLDSNAFKMVKNLDSITVGAPEDTGIGWSYEFTTGTLRITCTEEGSGVIDSENYWHNMPFINLYSIVKVIVEEGVREIGFNVFWNHRALTKIELPSTLQKMEASNFADNPNLYSVTVHPDNDMFWNADGALYCYEYDDSEAVAFAQYISKLCFVPRNFKGSYSVEQGTVILGGFACADCKGLTELVIPESLGQIDGSAFVKAEKLSSFAVGENSIYTYDGENYSLYQILEEPYEQSGGIMTLTAVLPIFSGHYVVPQDYAYLNINDGAFNGCESMTEITIGENVQSIGAGAFYGCSSLKKINFPEDISSVVKKNFGDAYWSYLGYACLEYTAIESVSLPKGITEIPDYCFNECRNLKNIDIPDTVYAIGHKSFYNCKALEEIVLPDSIVMTHTPYNQHLAAFEGCTSLRSVVLPNNRNFSVISAYFFAGCSSLESVTIPSNIVAIEDHAFRGCGLLRVNTNQVESIYSNAFSGCRLLTEANLPNARVVEDKAFADCKNLEKVYTAENAEISESAFEGCTKLYS